MIQPERVNELIDKFMKGTATDYEKRELDEWYHKEAEKEHIWHADSHEEEDKVRRHMLNKLRAHMAPREIKAASTPRRFLWTGMVAASLLLMVSIAVYRFVQHNERQTGRVWVESVQFENRYVLLPDSSKVILRPGAELTYEFTSDSRNVSLTGEAYFDVKSDSLWPFLVHTGDVLTEVVGTSFNIAAYSGKNVTVSVHTGKVSVADKKKKILAVLSPNEQLQYTNIDTRVDTKTAVIEGTRSWLNTDMQFTDVPLEKLILSLNRRYGVQIELFNPDMKECLITGSFDGTEPLTDVLDVLAVTTGATYSKVGKKIIFKGKGCMEKH